MAKIRQRLFRSSPFPGGIAASIFCMCAVAWLAWGLSFLAAEDETSGSDATSNSGLVVPPSPAASRPGVARIDRSHFMGARACLDCHRSEYVSWLGTQHSSNTRKIRFEGTENSIDTKYRQEVGNLDLCYTCHSAPPEERFGRTLVETATSCESCHGAAGGEGGWLNRHAVYGPNVTRLEKEAPEHYSSRVNFCDKAGMVRPGRQYEVAKNCLGCHIIAEPALVGEAVKHPVSFDAFSLIPYLLGEVRHNFHLDQRHNAETPTLDTLRRGLSLQQRKRVYLVVEQFAKMEVALNDLARLPDEDALDADFAGELAGIIEDAAGELEDFRDELEDPEDEAIDGLAEEQLASLQGAIDVFEAFDDLDQPTRAAAAASAGKIASLAARFLAEHDGSRLRALDVFFEDLKEPVGDALQP